MSDDKDTVTGSSGYEKPDVVTTPGDRYWMVAQSQKAIAQSEKHWRESTYYRPGDLRESRARSKDDGEDV
ncbi:MAG: hypothetical protein ACYSW8_32250 [Planctomycetota bacterium]|jgi:hypothetical protein